MPQNTDPSLLSSEASASRTPSENPVGPSMASDVSALPERTPGVAEKPEHPAATPAAKEAGYAPTENADAGAASGNTGLNGEAPAPTQNGSAPATPGPAAKLFNLLAATGPIAALLFLIAQLLPGLCLRGPSETQSRIQDALGQFPGDGSGIFTFLSGTPAPDLSPLYMWFMKGATALSHLVFPQAAPTTLLLCGSVLCAAAFVLGLWFLGTFTGGGRKTAFAACAVFLSTFSICGALQMGLPEVFSAALMLFSLFFLYLGWVRPKAPFFLLTGFLFAALATIAGGPAAFVFPLLTSFLFLIWRGGFRRAGALDGAAGFGLLLVLVLGWFSWISLPPKTSGSITPLLDFYGSQWRQSPLLHASVAETIVKWAFLFTLPWGFVALFLPWERFYRLPSLCWKNRTQAPGIGWIWCAMLGALFTAAFFGPAFSAITLPLAALASLLAGRAVLNLSARRSRLFFGLVSLFFVLLGLPLLCATLIPGLLDWMPSLQRLAPDCVLKALPLPGLYLSGIACLVFAALLLFVINKRFPAGGLLAVLLLATVATQPLNLFTLPELLPQRAAPAAEPAPAAPKAPATPAAEMPGTAPTATDAPTPPPAPGNLGPSVPAHTPEPAIPAVLQENTPSPASESSAPAAPDAKADEPAPLQPTTKP